VNPTRSSLDLLARLDAAIARGWKLDISADNPTRTFYGVLYAPKGAPYRAMSLGGANSLRSLISEALVEIERVEGTD
jgi:hypothetical protein